MEPETIVCQGKAWTRAAIPGEPVKVKTIQSKSRYCPVTSTVWEGRHTLSDGETVLTVELSAVHDAGKLGKSLTYTGVVKRQTATLDRVLPGMGYARAAT